MLASENAFLYFYSKNGQNSVENDRTGKKISLVLIMLKTVYKKVFLKYQVNTRSLLSCLASENDIFGGESSREKKKSWQANRESRQRTGCPSDHDDAIYIYTT